MCIMEHHGMKAQLTLEWEVEVFVDPLRMEICLVILLPSELFHQQGM